MKRILIWIAAIISLLLIILVITGNTYVLKGIRVVYLTGHRTAFIDDYTFFENDTLPPSKTPQPWPVSSHYNTVAPTDKLIKTHEELGTVAFLIIRNDSIWYEEYREGYGVTSRTNSFSMAKSVTVALLGRAIREGFISGLDQKVSDYYPQFQNTGLTVGDLASMASGLNWDESYYNPFGHTAQAYFKPNLAETILNLKVIDTPGESFTYLSGNTSLLAMVLEKATGWRMAEYLQKSLREPMGFKEEAIWQVDDNTNRLVKAYCCIASNARDFARFGKLFKNKGNWNGIQLLDSSFVKLASHPRFEDSPEYGYGFWLSNHLDKEIFVMRGILGQYVITIPEDDLIIVRLGHQRGDRNETSFTDDFYVYVTETINMLEQ